MLAGGKRLLSPKWQAFRGFSLAADATTKEASSPVVPQMPAFDFTPQPYDGPKADEILAKRKKFLNPALFLYYKKHVSIWRPRMPAGYKFRVHRVELGRCSTQWTRARRFE